MSDPTTPTGKRLAGEGWVATYTDDIIAIEQEAAAAAAIREVAYRQRLCKLHEYLGWIQIEIAQTLGPPFTDET